MKNKHFLLLGLLWAIAWLSPGRAQAQGSPFTTDKGLSIQGGVKGSDFEVKKEGDNEIVTVLTSTPLTFSTSGKIKYSQIVVKGGVNANIIFSGCEIGVNRDQIWVRDFQSENAFGSIDATAKSPLSLSNKSTATVTLIGTNELLGGRDCAGIQVPVNTSLTIKGKGSLKAQGGRYAAGIGGGIGMDAGEIRIESGTIEAIGGATINSPGSAGAAGIGGGGVHDGSTGFSHTKIIITGGKVIAKGGYRSSGIGTGRNGNASDAEIRIEGGYVKANPDGAIPGIGSIDNGRIVISGGTIEVSNSIGSHRANGTLTITGGSVKGELKYENREDFNNYLLTLESVQDEVNSVSVDGTPYFIDCPYPKEENGENNGKLYLYVPAEAKMVYVREGDNVVPYTIQWQSEGNPTATRGNVSTPTQSAMISSQDVVYELGRTRSFNVELSGGSGSSSSEMNIPMNTVLMTVTDDSDNVFYNKSFPINPVTSPLMISLNLDGLLPVGKYKMELQYGGDATYKPSAPFECNLTVKKSDLMEADFNFTPPSGLTYTGSSLSINGIVTSDLSVGQITPKFYKKDNEQTHSLTVKDAGTYIVKIDVAESDYYNSVTGWTNEGWEFTVSQADLTVTPLSDQAWFKGREVNKISYTKVNNTNEEVELTGTLSVLDNKIINPSSGGLTLSDTDAQNYKLEFTENVPITVYEGTPEEVEATGNGLNQNGWTNSSLNLSAPAGFVFTNEGGTGLEEAGPKEFSDEGYYYLKLKVSEGNEVYPHLLPIDKTDPVIPTAPEANSLTTTTATIILSDELSGIASYTVSEDGEVIATWPQTRAEISFGEKSLAYTYTGNPGSRHTLTFEVTDMAGNTASGTVEFTLKSLPPYIPSSYDLRFEANDSVRFSATATTVVEGGSFTFTAEVAEGYDPATLVVEYKQGRSGKWKTLEADSGGKYRVRSVWNDIYVRAGVGPVGDPTALEGIGDGASRIRAVGRRIRITSGAPVDVRIVSLAGRVVRMEQLPAGDSEIGGLPAGVYVVILSDGSRAKVAVR